MGPILYLYALSLRASLLPVSWVYIHVVPNAKKSGGAALAPIARWLMKHIWKLSSPPSPTPPTHASTYLSHLHGRQSPVLGQSCTFMYVVKAKWRIGNWRPGNAAKLSPHVPCFTLHVPTHPFSWECGLLQDGSTAANPLPTPTAVRPRTGLPEANL